LTDIAFLDQNARRSRAVVHGGTVYLAGQTADDRTAGIAEQTRQVLAKIDEMLAAAGTDKSRLLNVTIWLASMGDFAGMNAVYDAWVVEGRRPARCCSAVQLAAPDIRVEIMAVAAA
jgi:enamine deaminase RidA (YjgF/YER057c/UK114 family)